MPQGINLNLKFPINCWYRQGLDDNPVWCILYSLLDILIKSTFPVLVEYFQYILAIILNST